MNQEWITIDEAADRLGLAVSSVKALFNQGKIAVLPVPGGGRGWAGRLLFAADIDRIVAIRQTTKPSSDWLTVHQAARRVGLSATRIQALAKSGRLPSRIVGRDRRGDVRLYAVADIDTLQEQRKQRGTSNQRT